MDRAKKFLLLVLLMASTHYACDDFNTGVKEVAKDFQTGIEVLSDDFQTGLQLVGNDFQTGLQTFYSLHDIETFYSSGLVSKSEQMVTARPDWAWKASIAKGGKSQIAYVQRYKDVAIKDMKRTGIPASITIAQGILESAAGKSELCQATNNHFGIKCSLYNDARADGVINRHDYYYNRKFAYDCFNATDDHHYDHFGMYQSALESYGHHSWLLIRSYRYNWMLSRYQVGKVYQADSKWFGESSVPYYAAWALGLRYGKGALETGRRNDNKRKGSTGGYATNPEYPWKLIDLIQKLQLWRLDYEAVQA